MSTERIWGIDLGTTYSEIAIVNPHTGLPEVMKNPDGKEATPSVVSFERKADGTEQVKVGEGPKRTRHDRSLGLAWTRQVLLPAPHDLDVLEHPRRTAVLEDRLGIPQGMRLAPFVATIT